MAVMSGPFDALAASTGAAPLPSGSPALPALFSPINQGGPSLSTVSASSAAFNPLSRVVSSAVPVGVPMSVAFLAPTTAVPIAASAAALTPTLGPVAGSTYTLPGTAPAGSMPPVTYASNNAPTPDQTTHYFGGPLGGGTGVVGPPLPPVPSVVPSVGTAPQSFDPNVVTGASGPVSLSVPGGAPVPVSTGMRATAGAGAPAAEATPTWMYVAGGVAAAALAFLAYKQFAR
jgi:hypothetical protein